MKKPSLNRDVRFLILTLLISFFPTISAGESNETSSPFQALTYRLAQDGFDSDFLSNLLTDARTEFNPSLMILSLEAREAADFYTQFLTQEAILLSKRFLRRNLKILRKAERKFYVISPMPSTKKVLRSGFSVKRLPSSVSGIT